MFPQASLVQAMVEAQRQQQLTQQNMNQQQQNSQNLQNVNQTQQQQTPSDKKKRYKRYDKPPYTYQALIALAIQSSSQKMLRLSQILEQIKKMFPFFQGEYTGWKESVRHNLSQCDAFTQILRDPNRPQSKGNFWSVDITKIPAEQFRRQNTKVSRAVPPGFGYALDLRDIFDIHSGQVKIQSVNGLHPLLRPLNETRMPMMMAAGIGVYNQQQQAYLQAQMQHLHHQQQIIRQNQVAQQMALLNNQNNNNNPPQTPFQNQVSQNAQNTTPPKPPKYNNQPNQNSSSQYHNQPIQNSESHSSNSPPQNNNNHNSVISQNLAAAISGHQIQIGTPSPPHNNSLPSSNQSQPNNQNLSPQNQSNSSQSPQNEVNLQQHQVISTQYVTQQNMPPPVQIQNDIPETPFNVNVNSEPTCSSSPNTSPSRPNRITNNSPTTEQKQQDDQKPPKIDIKSESKTSNPVKSSSSIKSSSMHSSPAEHSSDPEADDESDNDLGRTFSSRKLLTTNRKILHNRRQEFEKRRMSRKNRKRKACKEDLEISRLAKKENRSSSPVKNQNNNNINNPILESEQFSGVVVPQISFSTRQTNSNTTGIGSCHSFSNTTSTQSTTSLNTSLSSVLSPLIDNYINSPQALAQCAQDVALTDKLNQFTQSVNHCSNIYKQLIKLDCKSISPPNVVAPLGKNQNSSNFAQNLNAGQNLPLLINTSLPAEVAHAMNSLRNKKVSKVEKNTNSTPTIPTTSQQHQSKFQVPLQPSSILSQNNASLTQNLLASQYLQNLQNQNNPFIGLGMPNMPSTGQQHLSTESNQSSNYRKSQNQKTNINFLFFQAHLFYLV